MGMQCWLQRPEQGWPVGRPWGKVPTGVWGHRGEAGRRSLERSPGVLDSGTNTRSFDQISKMSARVEKKLLESHWLVQCVPIEHFFVLAFFFFFARSSVWPQPVAVPWEEVFQACFLCRAVASHPQLLVESTASLSGAVMPKGSPSLPNLTVLCSVCLSESPASEHWDDFYI